MSMHPLHTQEWIDAAVAHGVPRNLISGRRTGKSTANALSTLALVIQHPGTKLRVTDHYGTVEASQNLLSMMEKMAALLGLNHIHFNRTDCTVVFENRERKQ
jgi:hypothetical protein